LLRFAIFCQIFDKIRLNFFNDYLFSSVSIHSVVTSVNVKMALLPMAPPSVTTSTSVHWLATSAPVPRNRRVKIQMVGITVLTRAQVVTVELNVPTLTNVPSVHTRVYQTKFVKIFQELLNVHVRTVSRCTVENVEVSLIYAHFTVYNIQYISKNFRSL